MLRSVSDSTIPGIWLHDQVGSAYTNSTGPVTESDESDEIRRHRGSIGPTCRKSISRKDLQRVVAPQNWQADAVLWECSVIPPLRVGVPQLDGGDE
jgi:hypothetical protein